MPIDEIVKEAERLATDRQAIGFCGWLSHGPTAGSGAVWRLGWGGKKVTFSGRKEGLQAPRNLPIGFGAVELARYNACPSGAPVHGLAAERKEKPRSVVGT